MHDSCNVAKTLYLAIPGSYGKRHKEIWSTARRT